MKMFFGKLIAAILLLACCVPVSAGNARIDGTDIYVPISELPKLVAPTDKAVLMDASDFAALLSAAKTVRDADDVIKFGQITDAKYQVAVTGSKAIVIGTLEIISTSEKPIFIDLGFAGFGLDSVKLDKAAAPLGYDSQGHLGLIVSGKGNYTLLLLLQMG